MELFDQDARLADACAAPYPDANSTDGHEGARRGPSPGSFEGT